MGDVDEKEALNAARQLRSGWDTRTNRCRVTRDAASRRCDVLRRSLKDAEQALDDEQRLLAAAEEQSAWARQLEATASELAAAVEASAERERLWAKRQRAERSHASELELARLDAELEAIQIGGALRSENELDALRTRMAEQAERVEKLP